MYMTVRDCIYLCSCCTLSIWLYVLQFLSNICFNSAKYFISRCSINFITFNEQIISDNDTFH